MKHRIAALAAAAVIGVAGGASAQTIELKLSHFLPPVHGMHKDFMVPWGEELAKRTGGKVKVTVFAAGSTFGNVAKQHEQVLAGAVDIAHGLHGIPRGRFPRSSVIEMPFLTESADAATRALWDLYKSALQDEYKDVKVLALHAHNGGLIHTRDRKVTTAADLKGLRIRTPSPAISEMLKHLGATPVGLPPGAVYENLQKGAIDGTVFPWDPVASFKLDEVLKYHLDARAYTVSFFFVMNKAKYDGLPSDVRKAIDDISGDDLIPKFGKWWNDWDAPGLAAAKARNNQIAGLTAAERASWKKQLEPMIDAYLGQLEKEGASNARQLYAEAQKLVAKYEKKN